MKAFDSNVELIGASVFPPIFSRSDFVKKSLLEILTKEGIPDPQLTEWYPVQKVSNFYKTVAKEFGPNTLFDIGKAAFNNISLPEGLTTLEEFLEVLNIIYNTGYRNGYIGFIKMVSHNRAKKEVVIQSYTPYVNELIRGSLTAFIRKYKMSVRVIRDEEKSTIERGFENNWYTVTYR
ncbi:hypothetical protein [Aureispira anguillae]|nr:hypothetical protein [Aureispira anguillae]